MNSNILKMYQKVIGCDIDTLEGEVRDVLGDIADIVHVDTRIKSLEKIQQKIILKGLPDIFSLKDVYGIRIIVTSAKEAYKVIDQISHHFAGFLKNDYIAYPKTRHDIPRLRGKMVRFLQYIAYKNNIPFEIQITTTTFHKMNEALHDGYKKRKYNL